MDNSPGNMDAPRLAAQMSLGQGSSTGGIEGMDTIRDAAKIFEKGIPKQIIMAFDNEKREDPGVQIQLDEHAGWLSRKMGEKYLSGTSLLELADDITLMRKTFQGLEAPEVTVPLFEKIQSIRRGAMAASVVVGIDKEFEKYISALEDILDAVKIVDGRAATIQLSKIPQPPLPPR